MGIPSGFSIIGFIAGFKFGINDGIPIFGIGKLPLFGTLPGLLLFPEPFPSKLGAAFGAGNPGSGAIGNGGFIIL